jgi:hypothetical protein
MDSIYDILGRLRGIAEDIGPEQRAVRQLPALFRPAQTSPQLSGPYPGQNATRGYLVGEDRYDHENPMARAVHIRIINQHPDWITRYGTEELMQAIEDVVGEDDWEEIGSSDVSAYVRMIGDTLRDRQGNRKEMDGRRPFAEEGGRNNEQEVEEGDVVAFSRAGMTSVEDEADYKDKRDKIYRLLSQPGLDAETKSAAKEQLKTLELAARNAGVITEETATEDVLSAMKKKLGDYLQDVATAIKTDPDLKDKIPQTIDQIKAVKTITTDDGKEIKITGNEDDGFRISIRNQEIRTPFKTLDEATMACEMYCARRRMAEATADYIEEKRS